MKAKSGSNEDELVAIWPGAGRFANITWQVSDVCNFRCSYCNPGNWGGHHRNLDVKRYKEVLGKIIDHFHARGYKSFKFFFSGGEPTVWPPLIELCEFIHSKTDRPLLAVNTNFSRPLDWWVKHQHLFSDVVASFHVEHTNQDKYLENAKYLQYRMPYLACRLLMHDKRFAEVASFADRLKSSLDNYVIEYAPLFEHLSPHSEMHAYDESWKNEYLKTHQYETKASVPFSVWHGNREMYCVEVTAQGQKRGLNSNRLVAEGKNFFKGWRCWIDESIFINPGGQIRLASCNAGAVVGNINQGQVELRGDPVSCPEYRCNCGTDLTIPKVRPDKQDFVESLFKPAKESLP